MRAFRLPEQLKHRVNETLHGRLNGQLGTVKALILSKKWDHKPRFHPLL
jgi:hypothetical protein